GILNGDDGELIINRGAETGTINGWNFGGATGLDNHSGSFSFYQEGFGNVKNSELISLDLNKVYHLGGWLKSYGTGGDSRIYFGFTPYDVNKDLITASDVRVVANTKTRFYEDCQSTDTKFTILDGSNWVILYHGSIAFNIDGSGNYADLPNRNRSNNLGTKNNEPTIIDSGSGYWNITLGGGQTIGKPCSAGEEIRQHTSGSNHIYAAANFDLVPLNTWNYYSGDVSGMAISGNPSSKWWHGTKYFKVMFLLNYFQTPTEKIRIDDISLNTTPPTYTGPLWIDGISGQAISFDGDNDYVIIADDPSLQFGTGNFSITAWIYPTPNTGKTRIANNRGTGIAGSSPGWEFKIEDFGGGWRFMDSTIDDGSTYATCDGCGGTYSYDQWYHVAMIYEAGVGLRFYVDGVLDGSVSIPSFGSITNSLPTAIGAAVANNGVEGIFDQHYKGKIDEVMIFNRMISGVEVGEIYNSQR
ncbi:MAG: LamG domain-containing protein, partial [Nanoarchaeota archaeon]|nr:LamG domain-containing protein [Nanoarchaeota archaeon]